MKTILESYDDKKTAIDLSANVRKGLRILLANQTEQVFSAQKKFTQCSYDPETLHQLRVHLRRLRAFLLFAKPVLKTDRYAYWQDNLKTWNRTTNLLRETDVLLILWHDITASAVMPEKDAEAVNTLIKNHRKNLSKELKGNMLNGRFIENITNFYLWLNKDIFISKLGKISLKKFAVKRIKKWSADMQKAGTDLHAQDTDELHQLRIIGKKVRYIIEGLKLDPNNIVLENLKTLQDDFGIIHDTDIYTETFKELAAAHSDKKMNKAVKIIMDKTESMKTEAYNKLDQDWSRFLQNINLWLKIGIN